MALRKRSLFLYGFEIDSTNNLLDFQAAIAGPTLTATIPNGFYTSDGLMTAICAAMVIADPANSYSFTILRNQGMSGTDSIVQLYTMGTHLSLLFASGPSSTTSVAPLIGFAILDYTGATTYTAPNACGTQLIPELVGYSFLPPTAYKKVIGNVNISASGIKETISYATHKFTQVEFKQEPEAKVITEWESFFAWACVGAPIEFFPDYSSSVLIYQVTLESTSFDGMGLGFQMVEQLSEGFPFYYTTGVLKFRIIPN